MSDSVVLNDKFEFLWRLLCCLSLEKDKEFISGEGELVSGGISDFRFGGSFLSAVAGVQMTHGFIGHEWSIVGVSAIVDVMESILFRASSSFR